HYSRLAVVRFAGAPGIVSTLDLPGDSQASQLTGNILHLAVWHYDPNANPPGSWRVVSVDLRQPEAPTIGASLALEEEQRSGSVARLTPGFAFIPNTDGLNVIPLSAATPEIRVAGTIPL